MNFAVDRELVFYRAREKRGEVARDIATLARWLAARADARRRAASTATPATVRRRERRKENRGRHLL
jgi:hypothetical protein